MASTERATAACGEMGWGESTVISHMPNQPPATPTRIATGTMVEIRRVTRRAAAPGTPAAQTEGDR